MARTRPSPILPTRWPPLPRTPGTTELSWSRRRQRRSRPRAALRSRHRPYVIAVGATDSSNSLSGWTAPTHHGLLLPGWFGGSQCGSGRTRHLAGIGQGSGSFVDVNNPSGLVAGDTSGQLFRGSGTSEATAVVSGSVALLLQAYPTLTPDQVKFALTSSADPLTNAAQPLPGPGHST